MILIASIKCQKMRRKEATNRNIYRFLLKDQRKVKKSNNLLVISPIKCWLILLMLSFFSSSHFLFIPQQFYSDKMKLTCSIVLMLFGRSLLLHYLTFHTNKSLSMWKRAIVWTRNKLKKKQQPKWKKKRNLDSIYFEEV